MAFNTLLMMGKREEVERCEKFELLIPQTRSFAGRNEGQGTGLKDNARMCTCYGYCAKSCSRQIRDEEDEGKAEEDKGDSEDGDSDGDEGEAEEDGGELEDGDLDVDEGESEREEVELARPPKKKRL